MFLYFLLIYQAEYKITHQKAFKLRVQLDNEFPRFLDLLVSEISIGINIETALYLIGKKTQDTLIGKEVYMALKKTELGVTSWQHALSDIAIKYDIDTLADLSMNIIAAYERGLNITFAIQDMNKEIKQDYVLDIRERCGKLGNTILLPVAFFHFLPMIAFMMVPAILFLLKAF